MEDNGTFILYYLVLGLIAFTTVDSSSTISLVVAR
uniref:Uncharacterized protein n=1 Tax=Setaria italica TaxID=4555 RepID=K3XU94_SETIT